MAKDQKFAKNSLGGLVRIESKEDACGLYKLVQYRPDHWGAVGYYKKAGFEVRASTPEEAVELVFKEINDRAAKGRIAEAESVRRGRTGKA